MVEIKSKNGDILSTSRNLAGVRRAARKYHVRIVTLNLLENGRGELRVWFSPNPIYGKYAAATCVTEFESFVVMCGFVRRWKSIYESESWIAGLARGPVGDETAQSILKHVESWGPSSWMHTKAVVEASRIDN